MKTFNHRFGKEDLVVFAKHPGHRNLSLKRANDVFHDTFRDCMYTTRKSRGGHLAIGLSKRWSIFFRTHQFELFDESDPKRGNVTKTCFFSGKRF